MVSQYGGKIVGANEDYIFVETWGVTTKIPRWLVTEITGVKDSKLESFVWLGKEVSILHDGKGEYHLRFEAEEMEKEVE